MERKEKIMVEKIMVGSVVCLILLIVALFAIAIYDGEYFMPRTAEKANQVCKAQGFDFYEGFERVGLLNSEPVAVTCIYASHEVNLEMRKVKDIEVKQ